jgi:hypothetical protein
MIPRPVQTGPQGGDKQPERRLTAKVPMRAAVCEENPEKEGNPTAKVTLMTTGIQGAHSRS